MARAVRIGQCREERWSMMTASQGVARLTGRRGRGHGGRCRGGLLGGRRRRRPRLRRRCSLGLLGSSAVSAAAASSSSASASSAAAPRQRRRPPRSTPTSAGGARPACCHPGPEGQGGRRAGGGRVGLPGHRLHQHRQRDVHAVRVPGRVAGGGTPVTQVGQAASRSTVAGPALVTLEPGADGEHAAADHPGAELPDGEVRPRRPRTCRSTRRTRRRRSTWPTSRRGARRRR